LIEAALELFVEKGFAATRAEEVAKRAGVSKGTLFLYFSSKEELFKAVVRENISGRFTEWSAELDGYTNENMSTQQQDDYDLDEMYKILEEQIVPMYYDNKETWRQITQNGMNDVRFQFDSNRMAEEYYEKMYKI